MKEDATCRQLLAEVERIAQDIERATQQGREPAKDQVEKYDRALQSVQANSVYQQVVAAQANFEKLMAKVNARISEGMKQGEADCRPRTWHMPSGSPPAVSFRTSRSCSMCRSRWGGPGNGPRARCRIGSSARTTRFTAACSKRTAAPRGRAWCTSRRRSPRRPCRRPPGARSWR